MRHADRWTESKYVRRGGRLAASRDIAEVGIGSRLITDLIAGFYAQHLPAYARGRLVDLGCGKAPLYGTYRTLVDTVTCVDWPQSPHANLYVDVNADLSGTLPFDDGAFDTIILSDVLEHVPDPAQLWREMARVLAPRGHAVLNVPFLYGLHEVPHDYARYTEFALRRFAQNAGFDVLQLQRVGGSLHVLADLLAKHLVRVPFIGAPMARAVQGSVSLLDRTKSGQRLAELTGARFPLGYFMVVARTAADDGSAAHRAP